MCEARVDQVGAEGVAGAEDRDRHENPGADGFERMSGAPAPEPATQEAEEPVITPFSLHELGLSDD